MSSQLTEMLIRHEGLRLKSYRDSKGILTIGVGRNIEGNGFSYEELSMLGINANYDFETLKITKEQALYLLDNDMTTTIALLSSEVTIFRTLDEVRKDVLIDMCFNLGINKFLGFKKMLNSLGNKDYLEASKEMMDSKWATDVGYRAEELSIMMARDIYLTKEEINDLQRKYH